MRFTEGSPEIAAIDVEVEEPIDDRWVFGHFRLLVPGQSIALLPKGTLESIGTEFVSMIASVAPFSKPEKSKLS